MALKNPSKTPSPALSFTTHLDSSSSSTSASNPLAKAMTISLPLCIRKRILAATRAGQNPKLQLGKSPALSFGKYAINLRAISSKVVHELHRIDDSGEANSAVLIANLNHNLLPVKAEKTDLAMEASLAQLKSSLAAIKQQKDVASANVLKMGPILPTGSLREMNKVLPRTASKTPSQAVTPAPVFHNPYMKIAKAIRKPLLHLLARKPMTLGQILSMLHCKEKSCVDVLERIARKVSANSNEWQLSDKAHRELEVWEFPYDSQDDRIKVIENCVRTFDRMRIPDGNPLWEMLLPKDKRGQGICLSRIVAARPERRENSAIPIEISTVLGKRPAHREPSAEKRTAEPDEATDDSESKAKKTKLSLSTALAAKKPTKSAAISNRSKKAPPATVAAAAAAAAVKRKLVGSGKPTAAQQAKAGGTPDPKSSTTISAPTLSPAPKIPNTKPKVPSPLGNKGISNTEEVSQVSERTTAGMPRFNTKPVIRKVTKPAAPKQGGSTPGPSPQKRKGDELEKGLARPAVAKSGDEGGDEAERGDGGRARRQHNSSTSSLTSLASSQFSAGSSSSPSSLSLSPAKKQKQLSPTPTPTSMPSTRTPMAKKASPSPQPVTTSRKTVASTATTTTTIDDDSTASRTPTATKNTPSKPKPTSTATTPTPAAATTTVELAVKFSRYYSQYELLYRRLAGAVAPPSEPERARLLRMHDKLAAMKVQIRSGAATPTAVAA